MASGSEVQLVLAAHERLVAEGVRSRVVNMASFRLFERQDAAYRESVLPAACRCRLAVEAATSFGWDRWVGTDGEIIGIDRFGTSARRPPSSRPSASPPTTSTRAPAPCWPARPPRSSKAQQHTRRSRRPRPSRRDRVLSLVVDVGEAAHRANTASDRLRPRRHARQHARLEHRGLSARLPGGHRPALQCPGGLRAVRGEPGRSRQTRRARGLAECLAAFHEYFEAHYDEQAVPYDGIAELLASVERRGLATAIVTGAGGAASISPSPISASRRARLCHHRFTERPAQAGAARRACRRVGRRCLPGGLRGRLCLGHEGRASGRRRGAGRGVGPWRRCRRLARRRRAGRLCLGRRAARLAVAARLTPAAPPRARLCAPAEPGVGDGGRERVCRVRE